MEHHNAIRYTLDALSFTTVVASLNGLLPPIAAALSIIWLTIQIGDWIYRKLK